MQAVTGNDQAIRVRVILATRSAVGSGHRNRYHTGNTAACFS